MVSSTLNPQAIIRSKPTTPSSFGSFMTGGSGLGSSTFGEATNKIVNFSRPNVSPLPSNITNIVSNISTNILNQVDNSIRNTTNFIKSDFENQINELRNDFYSRLSEVQANTNELQRDVIKTITKIQQQIIENPQSQVQSESSVSGIQKVIANIQEQVQNVLDNTLRSFSNDYQQKIKGFDDNRPNNVLSKFLDLYQNAIGFVNFFGNRKNIGTVDKNLKALRTLFTESFEVAKVLRQTITKIVKQLSNLPTASPNSGGLNLDIDVPGGRLKQAGGPRVRNIGKGVGLGAATGIGFLGLGGLATAASGMGKAKQYQEEMLSSGVQAAPMGQSIPEGFIDTFSNIVDRFASAVEGLLKGAKSSPSEGPSGGGGGPSPSPGSGPPSGEIAVSSAPGDEKLAAFVASMEASSPENAADALQVMLNRSASGKYGKGLSGVLSGYDQFSPISAAIFGRSADPNASAKYGPIAAKLPGNTPQEKFKYLQQVAAELDGLNKLQQLFGGGSANVAGTILNDPKYLEASRRNVRGALNFGAGSIAQSGDVKIRAGGNYFYNFTGPVGTLSSQPTGVVTTTLSQVSPAPTQTQQASRAQAISQPAQQVPTTISLPPTIIDASGGAASPQQSGGGTNIITPPLSEGKGPEAPFLPATNPDNFLTMYSRIVYNIVDG